MAGAIQLRAQSQSYLVRVANRWYARRLMNPNYPEAVVPPSTRGNRAGNPQSRGVFGRFFGAAGRFIFEVVKVVVVALAIIIPVRVFLFQPFQVNGQSMLPSFEDRDYLVIDEITYRFRGPERGEVVVFRYPKDRTQFFIKRIVGLPGETVRVKDGSLFIVMDGKESKLGEEAYLPSTTATTGNEQEVVLGEDEFFVLGDNRSASSDSRSWGVLPRSDIVGRAWVRAWPFNRAAGIDTPEYDFLMPLESAP